MEGIDETRFTIAQDLKFEKRLVLLVLGLALTMILVCFLLPTWNDKEPSNIDVVLMLYIAFFAIAVGSHITKHIHEQARKIRILLELCMEQEEAIRKVGEGRK